MKKKTLLVSFLCVLFSLTKIFFIRICVEASAFPAPLLVGHQVRPKGVHRPISQYDPAAWFTGDITAAILFWIEDKLEYAREDITLHYIRLHYAVAWYGMLAS